MWTTILMSLSIRSPKTINFLFVANGKLKVLCVPIFKHIRIREILYELSLQCSLKTFLQICTANCNRRGWNTLKTKVWRGDKMDSIKHCFCDPDKKRK